MVKDLERQRRYFIGQKLARPYIPLHQYAWPVGWRWVFTFWLLLAPVNSRFLIFTEEFMGCTEGEAGESVVRGCIEQWTIFSVFFFFLPSVSLVNEHLDPLGKMEKASLGTRHEKAEGSWRGFQENLRHWSVSNQLGYSGSRRTFSRSSSQPTLNCPTYEGKGNVWPDDLSQNFSTCLTAHILKGVLWEECGGI